MKNKLIGAVAVTILCITAAFSQAKSSKPRFTSVYTNFTTSCRNFSGEGGSDGYSLCRGPGGYRVRIYYSAAAVHFNAEIAKDDSSNFPIAMLDMGSEDRKTRLEWRLANRKPFAVIMRIPTYGKPVKDDDYFGPINGHQLVVKGLKGIELDSNVNAKDANANAKARELADAAYLSSQPKN